MIGPYLNPPENAVVFSVDEKTAIQALDRTVPVLPMPPGRAERHGTSVGLPDKGPQARQPDHGLILTQRSY